MKSIEFNILGVGVWGANLRNWGDLKSAFNGQSIEDDGSKGPKPEVIPANERRRAPLPVRLAIESSWQACEASGFSPADLSSVFVSGIGDTQLTDYMCRVLASENKALSPTKFHNSVHNAAAGYWTISTDCMQAANSVAGFEHSVPLALLEALIECEAQQKAMLITFYDAPSSEVLKDLLKNDLPFAASIVVAPAGLEQSKQSLGVFAANVVAEQTTWPEFDADESLLGCYRNNPAAKILPLLKILAEPDSTQISDLRMPLSSGTSLKLSVRN